MKKSYCFHPLLKNISILDNDQVIVQKIYELTARFNIDNVSRTKAYENLFLLHPEMRWSYLASMVSRNAGWNMTDLQSPMFSTLLSEKTRFHMFYTYEKANWFIFSDAFPQLLIYSYSTYLQKNRFHLLSNFLISRFMQEEWRYYWENKNNERLLFSLIVNEQNLLEEPLLKHPLYKRKVFHSLSYLFQNFFHLSSVIFPTRRGELYGGSVTQFTKLNKRISFGKKLARLLFDPELFHEFLDFSFHQNHTGSRVDYEQYLAEEKLITTPWLRLSWPIVTHHIHEKRDWTTKRRPLPGWEQEITPFKEKNITSWFLQKRFEIQSCMKIMQSFKK
ncbi:DUF2515 family protein [Bacillus sp. 2205SS5-2]|uniref:DUF2515 family protein n=1 Tax=Bacillus sp. 2205SS5-2 TaxID=3109031 RepID=UPI0030044238